MARNRIIYQSEAVAVSDGVKAPHTAHLAADINQISRVQSANYAINVTRTPIYQFGNLAKIGSLITEAPTVSFDMSYYQTNGDNETSLGFALGASTSFISTLISTDVGNARKEGAEKGVNVHIITVPDGLDVNDAALEVSATASVISIGNWQLTDYTIEAAVGGLPTVTVSGEGSNINTRPANAGAGLHVPSLDPATNAETTNAFVLPTFTKQTTGIVAALRPGDIQLTLQDPILTDLPATNASAMTSHIQSFSINIPLSRTNLERLGAPFGYAKVVDFPVEVTVNISALVADLQATTSLFTYLTTDSDKQLALSLRKPDGSEAITYTVKGAKTTSESYSSSIGPNKTVDLTFTATIGGPADTTNGVFVNLGP